MDADALKELVSSLIESSAPNSKANGFSIASTLNMSTEEMLMDGAIDQTFAFGRQTFVQLTAAKIEMTDRLQNEIPSVEQFVMQSLRQFCQQSGVNI